MRPYSLVRLHMALLQVGHVYMCPVATSCSKQCLGRMSEQCHCKLRCAHSPVEHVAALGHMQRLSAGVEELHRVSARTHA